MLYESGLLNNISDFYKIRYEDIIGLEKIIPGKDGKKESKISFKEKTASNIINGINESKKIPFARVIFALGIRYVGETVAKKLATSFKTIDNISSASYEELVEVDEIGERIANSVIAWFSKDEHKQIISELKNVGLNHEIDVSSENITNIMDGKTFVVSGVFENHSRDELKALVENNGGKNTSSISSKTGYVIAGENMGPAKKAKAEKFGIPILSESDFIELISNN
jgi:DNA ligase (NAD+)